MATKRKVYATNPDKTIFLGHYPGSTMVALTKAYQKNQELCDKLGINPVATEGATWHMWVQDTVKDCDQERD